MTKRLISSLLILTILLTFFPFKGYTESEKSEKIVSVARKYLGVPYKFGGSSPKGFDCSGFLYYVYDKVGIQLPRTAAEQYNTGEAVNKSDLQVGDLVFFETYKPGPSHSGIYVGNNKFIHASASNGISISSINDPYYWSSRYYGAKRVFQSTESAVLDTLPPGQYHDIPESHWAHREVSWLGENKYINGYDQSLFLPDELVTRSQAAVVLANVLGLGTSEMKSGFTDVPENHWAVGAITAVASNGFMNGVSSDKFDPESILTREQIAMILSRAFELKQNEEKMVSISDVSNDYWAHPFIQQMISNGIASTSSDGTYKPKQEITRAEFSVFIYRALHMK